MVVGLGCEGGVDLGFRGDRSGVDLAVDFSFLVEGSLNECRNLG